jgi:hypothetical protein
MHVGNTKASCLFFPIRFLKLPVTRDEISRRLVDKQQVNIINAKTVQCIINGIAVFIQRRPELCRKKKILSLLDKSVIFRCSAQFCLSDHPPASAWTPDLLQLLK